MNSEAHAPPAALHAAEVVARVLGPAVIAIHFYGSGTAGGLRPQSDIDLFVLVDAPVVGAARRALVAELLSISGWRETDAQARPLDVTVVVRGDVVPWRYPPTCNVLFGEWLRDDLAAGRIAPPAPRPDLAIQVTSVLQDSLALAGPSAPEVFDPVPAADLCRALFDCLPSLLANLRGDERNVLLTLARIAVTLETGRIVAKHEAAQWAVQRLPPPLAEVMDLARAGYLGERPDDWTDLRTEAEALAHHLSQALGAR